FEEVHIDTSEIELEDDELDEPIEVAGLDLPKGDDAFDN
ncbi:MAG: DNA-directed RNA polymerase subunit delta, partial [Solobacterium sp.]|nr:DNA-directed RNA polymerase subunit delta [Solobacterium sp.]